MLDIDKITITTLSENSIADIHYIAEWGLSIHIAIKDGPTILFDTGNRLACTFNANAAGIRLSDIDMIVLSHGHTDHTGGLHAVLEQITAEAPEKGQVDILCHPAAVEPQFVKHTDHYFYRGCPFSNEELLRLGANFKTSTGPVWINQDIVVSGEVPMVTDFEQVSPICFLKNREEYTNSPVIDDQGIFIRTDRGLLVISGCAHRGIINTILHAKKLTGLERVYLVMGGTHLLNTSHEQQMATLKALQEMEVSLVGVSHCTGMKPASFLAQNLGEQRFFFNNAGTRVTFQDGGVQVHSFERYDNLAAG